MYIDIPHAERPQWFAPAGLSRGLVNQVNGLNLMKWAGLACFQHLSFVEQAALWNDDHTMYLDRLLDLATDVCDNGITISGTADSSNPPPPKPIIHRPTLRQACQFSGWDSHERAGLANAVIIFHSIHCKGIKLIGE